MFKLIDVVCDNPECTLEPYEELLTDEEINNMSNCPLCSKQLKVDLLNRPRHGKHLSFSTWRVDLGGSR